MTDPLPDRAREAFAAYRGLGKEIIDELIFALETANGEVVRLRASNASLLAAANEAIHPQSTRGMATHCYNKLQAAIANGEKIAPLGNTQ